MSEFQWPLRGPHLCGPKSGERHRRYLLVSMAAPRPSSLRRDSGSEMWMYVAIAVSMAAPRPSYLRPESFEGITPLSQRVSMAAPRPSSLRQVAGVTLTHENFVVLVSMAAPRPSSLRLDGFAVDVLALLVVFQWPLRGPHLCGPAAQQRDHVRGGAVSMAAPRPSSLRRVGLEGPRRQDRVSMAAPRPSSLRLRLERDVGRPPVQPRVSMAAPRPSSLRPGVPKCVRVLGVQVSMAAPRPSSLRREHWHEEPGNRV